MVDLICWQESRAMANAVYDLTRLPAANAHHSAAFCQHSWSSRICHSELVEESLSFPLDKDLEFHFLDIAKGSAGEVRSQLYLAADQCCITPAQFESTRNGRHSTCYGLENYRRAGTPPAMGWKRRQGRLLPSNSQDYLVRESDSVGSPALDLPPEFCHPGTSALDTSALKHLGT